MTLEELQQEAYELIDFDMENYGIVNLVKRFAREELEKLRDLGDGVLVVDNMVSHRDWRTLNDKINNAIKNLS